MAVVTFKCKVAMKVYGKGSFSIYNVEVLGEEIESNSLGKVQIKGTIGELKEEVTYQVKAEIERDAKYGVSYKVQSLVNDEDLGSIVHNEALLTMVLGSKDAEDVLARYPKAVEMLLKGEVSEGLKTTLQYGYCTDKGVKTLADKEEMVTRYEIMIKKLVIYNSLNLGGFFTELSGYFGEKLGLKLLDLLDVSESVIEYTAEERIKNITTNNLLELVDKLIENISTAPYVSILNRVNVGFDELDKTLRRADTIYKANELNGELGRLTFPRDMPTSADRLEGFILSELKKVERRGSTYVGEGKLRREINKKVRECVKHFDSVVKGERIYFCDEYGYVGRARTVALEKAIAEKLKEVCRVSQPKLRLDIEDYREVEVPSGDGVSKVKLRNTDEQLSMLETFSMSRVMCLTGPAGSGKTQTVATLLKYLDDLGLDYKMACPTATAAKVLSSRTQTVAETVHRLLGIKGIGSETSASVVSTSLEADVVILDETSMLDVYLLGSVMESIDFARTRLVLVGDHHQLASVGPGNIFYDILESEVVPKVYLTEVFRYNEGGLVKIVTDTWQKKPFLLEGIKYEPQGEKGYKFIHRDNEIQIQSAIESLYKNLVKKVPVEDLIVITAMNKGDCGTVALNKLLQNIVNPSKAGEPVYVQGGVIGELRRGDLVFNLKNDYTPRRLHRGATLGEDEIAEKIPVLSYDELQAIEAKLAVERTTEYYYREDKNLLIANGELGKIVYIGDRVRDREVIQVVIVNYGGIYIEYTGELIKNIGLAYASTVHKMMGGARKYVLVVTPKTHAFMLTSNVLYVALSRAESSVWHIGDTDVVNSSVQKKEESKRDTFLGDFLEGNIY